MAKITKEAFEEMLQKFEETLLEQGFKREGNFFRRPHKTGGRYDSIMVLGNTMYLSYTGEAPGDVTPLGSYDGATPKKLIEALKRF